MIKLYYLTIFLLFVPFSTLLADHGAVSGFITDSTSGGRLIGANIYLDNGQIGGSSNLQGYYVLHPVPVGEQIIKVSYIGYRTESIKITIRDGEERLLNVALIPEAVAGEEVIVSAEALTNPREITISQVELTAQTIRSAPQMADIKVDLLNGGPQLEFKLVSPHGSGETVLHISAEKSPHVFQKLTRFPDNTVELSEKARKVKLYKNPLVPYLHADINPEGQIELSPVLKPKGSGKTEDQAVRWEQLEGNRISEQWVWQNNSYRPIEPISYNLKPYFNKQKPLVYKEKAAIDFLRHDLDPLLNDASFKPSERLQGVEVHDAPDVSHVQVETCDTNWLWLDPTYTVGRHTVTLSEILSSIDKDHCMRKDTDYIEIPKDIMDLWQRGSGITENGRIKMPKLGYLRTRAECGKKARVTTCNETHKFLANFDNAARASWASSWIFVV